jgi:hypothetical protein
VISATTVIVAILGSAIGGVVGSWLQIRHQRHEAFRERMLQAADDAATSIGAALSATRVALSDVEDLMMQLTPSEAASRTHKQARQALDEAGNYAGRVDLLYGIDSGIGDALRTARGSLRRALSEAGPQPAELDRALEAFSAAEKEYQRFVQDARRAAMSYGASRLGERARSLVSRRTTVKRASS